MNKRLGAVLAFAFVVSLVASFLIYQLVSAKLGESRAGATSRIFVAAQNLAVGDLIGEIDFKEADWTGEPPTNAVLNKEDLIGRGVIQNIYAGEPIVEDRLAAMGAGAGLASTIPTGMRAVALGINQVSGVSGFVVPGQHVDLIISGTPPGMRSGNLGTLTTTLLQNIEVLSAGQSLEKDAEGKPVSVPVINLLATPDQAEIISLAARETRIQLVLRNPLDQDEADTEGTATSRLFANIGFLKPAPKPARRVSELPRPAPLVVPPAPQEPKQPFVVEVFHGMQKSATTFKPGEEDEQESQQ